MFNSKRKMNTSDNKIKTENQELVAELNNTLAPKEELSVKETLIAKGTVLTGEIINESDVLVEGTVLGNIKSTRSIRIGKEGKVEGTLIAEKITINGFLKGQCQAQAVKILSQGRLDGDIHAGELSIERGGIFNGNSQYTGEKELRHAAKGQSTPAATTKNINKRDDAVAKSSTIPVSS